MMDFKKRHEKASTWAWSKVSSLDESICEKLCKNAPLVFSNDSLIYFETADAICLACMVWFVGVQDNSLEDNSKFKKLLAQSIDSMKKDFFELDIDTALVKLDLLAGAA